ncbi:hypothetical protein GOBAR_AA30346 [Gossypium barbadense]|uniref:Uncharacterized protein n=1 Tax=Gossypium barbadense TaxID=3634 RepID=A0A2P5WGV7_GOSBA|nr:hypothetical protein GOBAR_AA30346 [Gossypium barbadense]
MRMGVENGVGGNAQAWQGGRVDLQRPGLGILVTSIRNLTEFNILTKDPLKSLKVFKDIECSTHRSI